MADMRKFKTGATRDSDHNKPEYTGYLSPLVIKRYGEYMMKHAIQPNGKYRPGGNWKKGMPKDSYLDSMFRHLLDVWLNHEGYDGRDTTEEALCAVIFNASGYLLETLKDKK